MITNGIKPTLIGNNKQTLRGCVASKQTQPALALRRHHAGIPIWKCLYTLAGTNDITKWFKYGFYKADCI